VCDNKALMKMSGPKGQQVTEDCTHFNNEELQNLYYSLDVVRVVK